MLLWTFWEWALLAVQQEHQRLPAFWHRPSLMLAPPAEFQVGGCQQQVIELEAVDAASCCLKQQTLLVEQCCGVAVVDVGAQASR
mmetsp:Transcript_9983/g.14949  ORF Transcript_9983/g.14949 Transcript_9983/m.14949 type:complete len:85 (-) Transcript_9983:27-281(-)